VYFPDLLAPLLRSLLHVTSPPFADADGDGPKVIISYQIRSLTKESAFWSAFGLWFSYEPVLSRFKVKERSSVSNISNESGGWARHGTYNTADVNYMFVARRRQESYSWRAAEDDADLLDGIYAQGTEDKKGDDTFEMLLLMNMDDSTET